MASKQTKADILQELKELKQKGAVLRSEVLKELCEQGLVLEEDRLEEYMIQILLAASPTKKRYSGMEKAVFTCFDKEKDRWGFVLSEDELFEALLNLMENEKKNLGTLQIIRYANQSKDWRRFQSEGFTFDPDSYKEGIKGFSKLRARWRRTRSWQKTLKDFNQWGLIPRLVFMQDKDKIRPVWECSKRIREAGLTRYRCMELGWGVHLTPSGFAIFMSKIPLVKSTIAKWLETGGLERVQSYNN